MFNQFDHLRGAAEVRIRRKFLKFIREADISFLDAHVGVGGFSSIESLVKKNIDSILDLRAEKEHELNEIKKHNINYLQIKITDRNPPSLSESLKGLQWIKSNIEQDKRVFIHCNLGRGRGPLFAVLYLMDQGKSKEQAISFVKKIRKYTFLNKNQLKLINEFGKYLANEKLL